MIIFTVCAAIICAFCAGTEFGMDHWGWAAFDSAMTIVNFVSFITSYQCSGAGATR